MINNSTGMPPPSGMNHLFLSNAPRFSSSFSPPRPRGHKKAKDSITLRKGEGYKASSELKEAELRNKVQAQAELNELTRAFASAPTSRTSSKVFSRVSTTSSTPTTMSSTSSAANINQFVFPLPPTNNHQPLPTAYNAWNARSVTPPVFSDAGSSLTPSNRNSLNSTASTRWSQITSVDEIPRSAFSPWSTPTHSIYGSPRNSRSS